jgi:alpha,alpha-trehalase
MSNLKGFDNGNGSMFEKYNAEVPGTRGEGGEYAPQAGFGWTNGVALELIMRMHSSSSSSHDPNYHH